MLSKFSKVKGEKGFSLIELLIVLSIICILAFLAIPQLDAYNNRKYQAAAKSHLTDIFGACQRYWADKGASAACTETAVTGDIYIYSPSTKVTITLKPKDEATFSAKAIHTDDTAKKIFTIDKNGAITG